MNENSAPELTETPHSGQPVRSLQYMLNALAIPNPQLLRRTTDGIFGPKTREAVEAAQTRFGLPVTGVVDRDTWQRLYDEYLGIARTALAGANLPTSSQEIQNAVTAGQFPGYNLTYGNSDT